MNRTDRIIRFVEEQFLIEFGVDVTPQSDLFKGGVIDSFGYIRLMAFLEKEFSLKIESEEFLFDVPATLEAIDGFVAERVEKAGRADGNGAQRGGPTCAE
ncbi:acyl carrier protein [Streptomyces sp. MUM 203J]|uniref:acyl carrier protein n=1 Tax=Streptomyces sp. MUM 203J TaxID=2791990 RepID=UPI001F039D66|nr:acyl carrier protein [Streptomyces sp. MUM 203J]MCH0540320.1 acyl carrier protein [Streptomyces sp. MUM 203J]